MIVKGLTARLTTKFGKVASASSCFFHVSFKDFRVIEYDCKKLNMKKEVFEEYCDQIESDVTENNIIVFMKGSRYVPECGYSEGMVYLLDKYGVKYATRDVNSDENYKESLKVFSDWPTIPQLFINGELIGGLQIVKELHMEGELEEILQQESDDL